MKKLVIAEKPSVGREIAKNLACVDRNQGYIEGSRYIVTWALGHLVELAEPQHYSERFKRWSLKDLPMLPETLDQEVIEESKEQFSVIKKLLKRDDVSGVVIATDAGREGELVARWILKLCSYEGKCERLWISSQTEKAIKEGFENLKPAEEYDNLYHAAECRAAADWYVGMNVTRALTCYYDAKLSSGRVQTPTLALMTRREDEIDAFLGSFYYSARGDFGMLAASYYPEENSIRFQDDALAEEFKTWGQKKGVVTKMETEEKTELVPQAYDLTELQRDANITLGFSAKETLDTLQRLYEIHKIVTYPRTDSRCITPDIIPTLPERIRALQGTIFSRQADEYLENGFRSDNPRFVNEAEVSDHHAIIPTEQKVDVSK
ncbi:MAG: DNA topoisomerase III, partial [Spirochaetales bacterium]|nr:DNA topoisomerase III [Candidatus Physcosoma equi]